MLDDLTQIVESCHDLPHETLGPHQFHNDANTLCIRTFLPNAVHVSTCLKKPFVQLIEMNKVHPEGLFEAQIPGVENQQSLDYTFQVVDENGHHFELRDAYSFAPVTFDPAVITAFLEGEQSALFKLFGAHLEKRKTCQGVRFGVWAPNAQRVSVVGNFNRWDGRCHPMQKISDAGFWALFIPDLTAGDLYKFEIKSNGGAVFLKTDPYAFMIEASPEAAGIVHDLADSHHWQDAAWMYAGSKPIVSVHAFDKPPETGRQTSGGVISLSDADLNELKKRRVSHIVVPGFCDVKHEVAAFFMPNPKLGTPARIMAFIDRCHQHGLGIIIDVIPRRLTARQKNLVCFDGSPLFEQINPDLKGFHFDLANPGVRSFFLSNARFWREKYHIDGFRVDSAGFAGYLALKAQWSAENAGVQWLVHEPEPVPPATDMLDHLFQQRKLENPFSLLGPQKPTLKNSAVIRAILPDVAQVFVYFPDEPDTGFAMTKIHSGGLWQATVPVAKLNSPYRYYTIDRDGKRSIALDPYAVPVSFISTEDKQLFAAGQHYHIYQILGAHKKIASGIEGVNFAVWAPNAAAVSVVGDFSDWDEFSYPMRLHVNSGVWELFIPGIDNGAHYKFAIFPRHGPLFLKSDPYAFYMKTAPDTDSVVYQVEDIYKWHDQAWLDRRRTQNVWRSPVSIYEVHLGSWRRGPDQRLLNYREIAEQLIPYVLEMGFTHIEILPVAEHPYEPSWGYQVSNFYAPTSRLGKPEDLMAFIDLCHQHGIGVLLDWVAGHFPKDAHALAKFDGTHLYEHEDPRKGEHKDWGTLIFNYCRHEAENFLIANALFWLEYYHFDGLRVDAVASMLYLDYSRKAGEWIPNIYGGNENLEAIEFLKQTNYVVHGKFPGTMMIAEESTAWAGVSRPTDSGGLGFGFKWNMGWMHDVLDYLQTPPEYRKFHHNQLTFVFHYAFEENFILSLSHDEVVHLKGSLYTKMPGNTWEKFANLRLLYIFMFTHPGKKLNFMGAEFAQIAEWSESGQLQWELLDKPQHQSLQAYIRTLNALYRNEPVLHEMDCRPAGFQWIEGNNHEQSIIIFSRKARDPRLAIFIVINFSAISRFDYRIGVPYPAAYTEILNTNDIDFGGFSPTDSGKTYPIEDFPWHQQEFSITLDTLPALSAILLKPASPP